MLELHNILCPVDFSEGSEDALVYGIELAQRFNARVHVGHVLQPMVHGLAETPVLSAPQFIADLKREVRSGLDKLIAKHADKGVELVPVVVDGMGFAEIVQLANDLKCDLIVMGTHGRTGLKHLVLGSVAERVVRFAECPVLTVHARKK